MGNYVITIARGFGSGGKEIGSKLAKRLGIHCYESQILKMASEDSGINEALFIQADEKVHLYGTILGYMKKIPFSEEAQPNTKRFISDVNLFNIQSKIIRQLADQESCIIIGKCADYVLRDFKNVVRIYIDAPREACVQSIVNKLDVTEKEAHSLIEKTDKYRSDYYRCYTEGKKWTDMANYDLTLNSARVGREMCVDLIEQYVKMKFLINRR